MRFQTVLTGLASLATMLSPASAAQMLQSTALAECQSDNRFSASLFKVIFTPNNNSASFQYVATSSIDDYIKFDVRVSAYGYPIIRKILDPCELGLNGLCPMQAARLQNRFNQKIDPSALQGVPGIAYTVPDLDASVRVYINRTKTGEPVACLEARISNGKTVDQLGIKWATAIISGLALVASAIINGLGSYNAAAHLAANALSLFSYFQSQAILGLTAVHLPPIVQSWTQDFQWSMGIIKVGFIQTIATWYQRATGGKPSTLFQSLGSVSVSVQKRGLELASSASTLARRINAMAPARLVRFMSRATSAEDTESSAGAQIVRGIDRVAFESHIEKTNLFLTGFIFFLILVVGTVLAVAAFHAICQLLAKKGKIKADRFIEFRREWLTVLKGILFRIALLGFPSMTILCLWEFTQVDSPAEVALAVLILVGLIFSLGWAASKVIRIGQRSIDMHQNPAYILYSDPRALNKWGFLYIQFRAQSYYFIVPVLSYILLKSIFVAFAQSNGLVQAIAFILIEAAALIATSVIRPWMDKPTNSFNLAICVINFINAVFLLIFSNVFGAPGLVVGVIGVVLFVLNAAFACVLLIMVIISTTFMFFRKNPDARYQYMADDRVSFMKSQTQFDTLQELDALAVTARGDMGSFSDNHSHQSFHSASQAPRSPVDPTMPLFPSGDRRPTKTGFYAPS